MKSIILILSLLYFGWNGNISSQPVVNEPVKAVAVAEQGDDCECYTYDDSSVGRWTLYVKNPCESDMVADCWYVVEYADGTKDTRTSTVHLRPGSSTYVDTDFLSNSQVIEHGCSSRIDE